MAYHFSNKPAQRAGRSVAHNHTSSGIAKPAGAPVLQSAGVTAVAQRVILKNNGSILNPKKSSAKWNLLTEAQQTKALRLINDHYRGYYFRDYDHFFAYMNGTDDPTKIDASWRKQAGGIDSKPYGVQDPFVEHHDDTGKGGLGIENQVVFGFGGSSLRFKETTSHTSNWANFVELHYDKGMKMLMDASKWGGKVQTDMEGYYNEAIKNAEIMDHQFATKKTALDLSTKNNVWAGVAVEQNVNKMRKLVAAETGTSKKTIPKAILPKWGALYKGMGTSVNADFYGGKNQSVVVGSKADKTAFKPHWLEGLDRRIGAVNTSYYIEGHLLNDNLGGPAAPYNIVPLTGDANAVHLHLVETFVKKKVLEMTWEQKSQGLGFSPLVNPIDYIHYDVTADFSKHPQRPATKQWIDAYNFLKDVIDKLKIKKLKVDVFRNNLLTGTYMPGQVNGKSLNYADTWNALQAAVNFVIPLPGDRANIDMAEMLRRFDLVSELFVEEEKYVPVKLICNSKTVRKDGNEDGDGRMSNVPVVNEINKIPATGGFRE